MSIKTTITCDKCGALIIEQPFTVETQYPTSYLCPKCAEKFEKWLKGECKCRKTKADKPAKNLPSGWTVHELAEKFDRGRSTVQQVLNQLHPAVERKRVSNEDDPSNWHYEYHLTAAQFDYLRRRFKGGDK